MFNLGGKRVCPEHKTWTCGCASTTPECETDEPTAAAPERDADFAAKTWAELARLVGECRNERRFVAHPSCSDSSPCRHCGTIRNKHRLINDHIDQLETAALEDAYGESA